MPPFFAAIVLDRKSDSAIKIAYFELTSCVLTSASLALAVAN